MEDKTLSLTDQIYQELVDGLKTEQDYTHLRAKYDASKGPFYNALGRLFRDMWPKVQEFNEVQGKLNQAGLKLDQLDRQIKQAESSLAPLEERKSALNEQIETLETKLAEKSEAIKHVGELEKLGFNIERLRQLREALTEIGAKHGLKDKEAVSKFFSDLKDYEAVLGAESLLKGLQTQIETKKLEAENWQAKEEALKRKHDDLKEAIGAVYALRAKGVKASQIPVWQRILDQFGTVEQFGGYLTQYGDITKLLNARKEEAESYELRLTKAKSEVETLEKERAKIEAAIDALKEAGIKQIKAMVAKEIGEIQAVGGEVRAQFNSRFAQYDQLLEGISQASQKLERLEEKLRKYEPLKQALESHAVASEAVK